MRREIIFRGKRIKDGKWLYGYYLDEKAEDTDFPCIVPFEPVPDHDWEVDPETVGVFTGMLDQNGEKLFEGDIVMANVLGSVVVSWSIQFLNSSFVEGEMKKRLSPQEFPDLKGTTLIGNIYDNPDLLVEGGLCSG